MPCPRPCERARAAALADAGLLQLCLPATADAVRRALTGPVADILAGVDPALRATVETVLAEALNNIVEHAYAGRAGMISLGLHLSPSGLFCCLNDDGAPMPGGRLPVGCQPAGLRGDATPEGGFGWHLIRSLVRDLGYERRGGRNRLCFRIPFDGVPLGNPLRAD